jgi:hypothetical protein
LDPKWKGKLGANRNNYMVVAAMIDLYGKEKGENFIRKLAQQEPQVRSGGTLTATLVGAVPFHMADQIDPLHEICASGSRMTDVSPNASFAIDRLASNTN